MRKAELCSLVVGLFIILGITGDSMADTRSYVWTYEYMTLPSRLAEIEYSLTTKVPDTDKSSVNTWEHWLGFEYGITDKWDAEISQMWKQNNTGSNSTFGYDGFKIESRYRFGGKGKFFVDPELYFEYARDDDLSKPNVGEAKLILAKDFGDFNVSYNQIIERNLEREGKTNHEYAVGLSYSILPDFKLGVESKGSYNERECAIGPTLSWVNSKFWLSFGAVFGLNERTDDIQTRMIVGIPF